MIDFICLSFLGVAVLVVDKFGRKPLLAFSDITMCISIFALGTYFYLDENKQCALGQTETYNCRLDSNISPETVDNLGILPLVCANFLKFPDFLKDNVEYKVLINFPKIVIFISYSCRLV